MAAKIRCQSCGMPIFDGYFGTEADGQPSSDYCTYCYQHGGFTAPDQTVDGMVQSSIDFMSTNLGYDRDEAARLSNEVIRGLKRWA